MKEILDQLDGLRADAGSLTAETEAPAFDQPRAEAVGDYFEHSIISSTERINAIRDIIERINRLKGQLEEEQLELQSKRGAFVNAFVQVDSDRAHKVIKEAQAMEETFAQREKGEFASMAVWEAARIILQRAGRDMTTREIAEALRKGGKKLVGVKATSSVSAALQQGKAAEVFQPVKISGQRQRWALREPEQAPLPEREDNA